MVTGKLIRTCRLNRSFTARFACGRAGSMQHVSKPQANPGTAGRVQTIQDMCFVNLHTVWGKAGLDHIHSLSYRTTCVLCLTARSRLACSLTAHSYLLVSRPRTRPAHRSKRIQAARSRLAQDGGQRPKLVKPSETVPYQRRTVNHLPRGTPMRMQKNLPRYAGTSPGFAC